MTKSILSIIVATLLMVGTPVSVQAGTAIEIIDNDEPTVGITVSGSSIRVSGATGMTLTIYNITGVRVMSVKVDSPDKHFDLDLPKGCYIIKVGKTVRKISIR